MKRLLVLLLIGLMLSNIGCRRVTIVSDSLLATDKAVLFSHINTEDNWIYTDHIVGGTTSYTNPILKDIYSIGMVEAFSYPDATVMSFGTNEAAAIYQGKVDYESAFESFWRLAHQAVEAGSRCIVLFEGSHTIYSPDQAVQASLNSTLTNWFYDMHQMEGVRVYLDYEYKFVIASISDIIETDVTRYISDYVHLTQEGTIEAGKAISNALNSCPDGRWVFEANTLKEGETPSTPPHYILVR
jgi:hypothetical protein